jgi:hypothetical protein
MESLKRISFFASVTLLVDLKRKRRVLKNRIHTTWLRRPWLASLAIFSIVAVSLVQAAETDVPEGTSSRDARENAFRSIPLSSMTQEAVRKLRPVLDDPTIFRRMPRQTIPADPEFFNFIVRHPEVLVEIWREMGVTQVETKRLGAYTFSGNDGAGTQCRNELILGSDRLHVYYSEGFYEGGMVARKLEGRCVCVVYGNGSVADGGQTLVQGHMDIFLKLDNLGADLLAKTISPLVVKTADYNYVETLRFISQLSIAAQRDPDAVERLSEKLTNLKPEVRNGFIQSAKQSALRRDRLISAYWKEQLEKDKSASVKVGRPIGSHEASSQR